eukprot:SAG31_NODE_34071_length_337_cov_0.432773_1_plen_30_part_10
MGARRVRARRPTANEPVGCVEGQGIAKLIF